MDSRNAATLRAVVDEAAAAEVGGLATYSVSNIFSHEAIGALTVAATQTQRIELQPMPICMAALSLQNSAWTRAASPSA